MPEYYLTTNPVIKRTDNHDLLNFPAYTKCCAFIKNLTYNDTIISLKVDSDILMELNKEYLNFYFKEMQKIGIKFDFKDNTISFNTDQVKNDRSRVFVIFTLLRFPFKYYTKFNTLMKTVFDIKKLYPKLNFFKSMYISHTFNSINTSGNGMFSNLYMPINNVTKESLKKDLFNNVTAFSHCRHPGYHANNFCRGILITENCWDKIITNKVGLNPENIRSIATLYSSLVSGFNNAVKPSDLKKYVKFFQDYNNKVLKQIT